MSCPNINQATSSITLARDDRRPGETLDHWQARLHADRVAVLPDALNGVELSTRTRRVIDWLTTWEPDMVETITSLFERVRSVGPSGGHQ